MDISNLRLNLGRFDDRVSYLLRGQNSEYSLSQWQRMLYFINKDREIGIIVHSSNGGVVLPTFDIGANINRGRISDSDILQLLMSKFEFKILYMIQKLCEIEGDNLTTINQIIISVKSISVHDDDKSLGCYGWIEVGIGLMTNNESSKLKDMLVS